MGWRAHSIRTPACRPLADRYTALSTTSWTGEATAQAFWRSTTADVGNERAAEIVDPVDGEVAGNFRFSPDLSGPTRGGSRKGYGTGVASAFEPADQVTPPSL